MADVHPNESRTGTEPVSDAVVMTDAGRRVTLVVELPFVGPAQGFLAHPPAGRADPPAQPQQ